MQMLILNDKKIIKRLPRSDVVAVRNDSGRRRASISCRACRKCLMSCETNSTSPMNDIIRKNTPVAKTHQQGVHNRNLKQKRLPRSDVIAVDRYSHQSRAPIACKACRERLASYSLSSTLKSSKVYPHHFLDYTILIKSYKKIVTLLRFVICFCTLNRPFSGIVRRATSGI